MDPLLSYSSTTAIYNFSIIETDISADLYRASTDYDRRDGVAFMGTQDL